MEVGGRRTSEPRSRCTTGRDLLGRSLPKTSGLVPTARPSRRGYCPPPSSSGETSSTVTGQGTDTSTSSRPPGLHRCHRSSRLESEPWRTPWDTPRRFTTTGLPIPPSLKVGQSTSVTGGASPQPRTTVDSLRSSENIGGRRFDAIRIQQGCRPSTTSPFLTITHSSPLALSSTTAKTSAQPENAQA